MTPSKICAVLLLLGACALPTLQFQLTNDWSIESDQQALSKAPQSLTYRLLHMADNFFHKLMPVIALVVDCLSNIFNHFVYGADDTSRFLNKFRIPFKPSNFGLFKPQMSTVDNHASKIKLMPKKF